jgi:hypothetical protein
MMMVMSPSSLTAFNDCIRKQQLHQEGGTLKLKYVVKNYTLRRRQLPGHDYLIAEVDGKSGLVKSPRERALRLPSSCGLQQWTALTRTQD